MNDTIRLLDNRRSIRAYRDEPLPREAVDAILHGAMRAPTAGNMMLYSILEIADQGLKQALAVSCDNQPFIAKAPLVLVFLADYQRWFDLFMAAAVPAYCEAEGRPLRLPGEGDLMLACCDALIAAQNAVVVAESLGIGSCYIGDIMEHFEYHRDLLDLPRYTFPVGMLCFGYPREAQIRHEPVPRFSREMVYHVDRYQRLDAAAFEQAVSETGGVPRRFVGNATNLGQHYYARKFGADFSFEMTRSVRAAIASWVEDQD